MRIALIHHSDDLSNDYAAYLAALLDEIATSKEYVIKDYDHVVNARESIKEENVLLHIVIPANSSFSLKYWYSYKLARILKKYRMDKTLCLYGVCTSSNIDQILVVPDMALLRPQKGMLLWQQFATSKMKESLQLAASVLTYSATAAEAVRAVTNIEKKINVIPYTAPEIFVPMEWHNKLYVKSRYAQNKEYFIAILPDNNEAVFVDLLKAYSKFKKWQQSGMKLILLPKEEGFSKAIEQKLDTYKYREDVSLVNDADKKDVADLIAAAYALLHPAMNDADLWPMIIALQCNTPVITTNQESLNEYGGEAAVYVAEKDPEAFGDKLNQLYKEEEQKTKMVEAAALQTANYKQQDFTEQLWQLLTQQQ
ncbi:glycosyltransferase family 4 protein [Panacibacter ginsenosidivorans]|uniref:Glycosyltransferase family 4 protein n=1 Tax=Panacibacter ginsenosidivorans TaxID=1813871 RepID=A0A5B8VDJ3_9BACT|nr:glycosyltransferase [Panacibacter ginsenosidivorans]QEC68348.1 glycosyltransferase family 4 protein [Panacibacter ginsenosidivorans]